MHVASRLSPESTSCSDLSQTTTRVVRALRPAPTTTTLVIPLSECCESRTPPIDFGPRTTLSTVVTSSVTSGVRAPSNTNLPSPSPPTTVGPLPGFAIAAIVVGILLVLAGAAFIFYIYRRRKQRRQNSRKAKGPDMYHYPEYQTVPANQPRSSPSHSPSNSSVTTEALLDLGLYESDDANEYTYLPVTPPQPQHTEQEMVQIRRATPSPRPADRRSVDTVFALWFYATTELDRRRSKGSSYLAELPSAPSPPVPALPTSPPPPVPTSSPEAPNSKRSSKARRTYLTPAGTPWKPGPPPAAPLPPPPPVSGPSTSTSPAPRKTSNPRFSLFPAPPKPPPKNILKNINSSRSPIPGPLKITPLTNHPLRTQRTTMQEQQQKQPEARPRTTSTGMKSAPLPSNKPLPLSPPISSSARQHRPRAQSSQSRLGPAVGLGLQTEGMVDIPLHNTRPSPSTRRPVTSLSSFPLGDRRERQDTATRPGTSLGAATRPQTPGTAPATSTRFNEGLLTPPMGQGGFPPPPGAGHKTRRSLPGISGSRWFSGFGGWRSPKHIS
ncbi:hypothetical protein QBC40DRAFT_317857 [Triangularia verruculosa]|uniref:Uncharacterized protein n=1 Tax=Triangularia verruculosa TaxID=2587418 RepID=A0AAN7AXH9_9PEZI|nr:hypothetical protein QBC40DRAFT_317857 [Triangularia verruculosa]